MNREEKRKLWRLIVDVPTRRLLESGYPCDVLVRCAAPTASGNASTRMMNGLNAAPEAIAIIQKSAKEVGIVKCEKLDWSFATLSLTADKKQLQDLVGACPPGLITVICEGERFMGSYRTDNTTWDRSNYQTRKGFPRASL